MEDKLYKGIIYKYTSFENKIYIGTTINEKERRRRNICQILKGNRYQCSNCIFRYKTSDDYPKFIEINPTKQQKKIILKLNKNGDIIKEYPSIESAAIDAGVNRATMSKYVNGHGNSLKHTNYIWRKKYE